MSATVSVTKPAPMNGLQALVLNYRQIIDSSNEEFTGARSPAVLLQSGTPMDETEIKDYFGSDCLKQKTIETYTGRSDDGSNTREPIELEVAKNPAPTPSGNSNNEEYLKNFEAAIMKISPVEPSDQTCGQEAGADKVSGNGSVPSGIAGQPSPDSLPDIDALTLN